MVAPNVREVVDAPLKLTAEERESIAELLFQSLHTDEDADLSPEWEEEIARRLDALEQGKVELLDGEPIMRALKEGRMP